MSRVFVYVCCQPTSYYSIKILLFITMLLSDKNKSIYIYTYIILMYIYIMTTKMIDVIAVLLNLITLVYQI